jgi:hypothetical protein
MDKLSEKAGVSKNIEKLLITVNDLRSSSRNEFVLEKSGFYRLEENAVKKRQFYAYSVKKRGL